MSPRPRNSRPATSFSGASAGTSSMNRAIAVSISALVSEANRPAYRPPACSDTPPSNPETSTVPSFWIFVCTAVDDDGEEGEEPAASATGALAAAANTTAPATIRRRMIVALRVRTARPPSRFDSAIKRTARAVRTRNAATRSDLVSLQELAADHHPLDLRRALADQQQRRVPVQPLDLVLLGVAVAAMDPQRLLDTEAPGLRREQLRHPRLDIRALARVLQARRSPGQQPRRLDLGSHVGELELNRLVL